MTEAEFELFEIKKEHDSGAYFWIQPVTVEEKSEDKLQQVKEYADAEISISDICFGDFLYGIMKKHYDAKLIYNQQRHIDITESNEVFEWYLVHNFYTYECMEKMLVEYEELTSILETDDVEKIKEIYKLNFRQHFKDTEKQEYTDALYVEDCKRVRAFLVNFVSLMRAMMTENAQTDLVWVMGQ